MSRRRGASSVEVYGFVGWIASFVASAVFCLWAWLPEEVLQAAGVTYYPNKEWALVLPAYLLVAVLCTYWAYESLNMMTVPDARSFTTLFDAASKWSASRPSRPTAAVRPSSTERIPPLVHLPPPRVSEVLYSQPQQQPS